jgi:hypothetical protein
LVSALVVPARLAPPLAVLAVPVPPTAGGVNAPVVVLSLEPGSTVVVGVSVEAPDATVVTGGVGAQNAVTAAGPVKGASAVFAAAIRRLNAVELRFFSLP